ncbi:PhoX family protein [Flavitalea antarctica]
MKSVLRSVALGACFISGAMLFTGCQKIWEQYKGGGDDESSVKLKNYSVTPSLIKMFDEYKGVDVLTLIGSEDVLPESPGFVFGAQPDGAALMKNPNGKGYIMINNHEIHRSVSRVYLDKNFKPTKGEYIVDFAGGQWRLCSATLATPEEHGFGPIFLTAGESGADSRVHAINPLAPASERSRTDRILPALGRHSMENAVPLPKDAYPAKTVIMIGEDDSNGQFILYVAERLGDLTGGKLYFLRRTNQDPVETNIELGKNYDVELVEIDNAATVTGAEIAQQSIDKKCIQFARVEDLDYRKGGGANGRELYFTATGVANTIGKTMWGRVYRLQLDKNNPLKGKIEVVADGGTNPGNDLINPDNICVTDNYVYIQEDGDSYYPGSKHDSYVWIMDIKTKKYKPFLTMDHRRTDPAFSAKYNTVKVNNFGSWEFGAMYDISKTIGVPGTFLLNIHPHTWQEDKFLNVDGSGLSPNKEGGQVLILRGVPN